MRVSCRWRFLCFSELSKFLRNSVIPRSAFRAFVLFALFALRRCWIFVGLSFVGRAFHNNAFLLVFDSASAFRGEKRQRQTHGAANSVGGASRFDAVAHASRRQVFATKTRSRKNDSERRKRTRCASRCDYLKTRRANPCRSRGNTRCCDMLELQQSLGAIHSDAPATVNSTVRDGTIAAFAHSSKSQHEFLSLASRPKQGRFLVASKESYSYFFFFLRFASIVCMDTLMHCTDTILDMDDTQAAV